MSKPVFYYPVTMNLGGSNSSAIAPLIPALPVDSDQQVAILAQDNGASPQGLYANDGDFWRFALPYVQLSAAAIFANSLTVYIDPTSSSAAPAGSTVYKNGVMQAGLAITAGTGVYAVLTPLATGGGGGGYTLPPATAFSLGGVIVPASSNIMVDGSGNIDLKPAIINTINNKLDSVDSTGTGTELIFDGSGPIPLFKTLTATGALSLTDNGSGTLTLNYTLPTASASVLGGIKIGSGLSIDGAGVVSATSSGSVTLTGDVTGSGTGSVPTVLSTTGVVAGAYTKVTVDAKGRVTVGANLSGSDVNTALGYTAYNGATNPSGFLTANQTITATGDVTGSGTNAITLTLANVGTAGTFKSVTVDAKGRVTSGTNPTTLAGFGITNGLANTGGAVTGDLTFSSGATIHGLPLPSANTDVATKIYVDNAVAALVTGTSWRQNAQVTTTANITLSGLQTIDGYAVQNNDRVLVKNQTNQTENGVYVASGGAWTRATDTDTGAEIKGMAILVLNGTVSALTQWVNTNTSVPTLGTDPVTYSLLQGAGTVYSAGTGLNLSANTFSIANTGVVANTYTKVTVNAQGQVTTGTNLNAGDVNTALGYTAYNGTTNPSGFLTANQAVTLSGDATGSGSTAIAVVLANSGVSAGTFTKVTVDAKGRVTVGANLAAGDITTALGFTPVNKAGDTMNGALNWATTVSIVAAATTDIGTAASNSITVTGNTAITALGTAAAGAERWATFTGTPTLTHNAASLILPTGANIVVASGDSANFMSLGGGNWRCISYTRADGTSLSGSPDSTKLPLAGGTLSGPLNLAPSATVASAATTNIGAATANDVSITGSTTITAFDIIAAGAHRVLTFGGVLTLTHNAVSLILPTGANIATAAGDTAEFVSLGGGNWKCLGYERASGQALVATADASKFNVAGGTFTGVVNNAPAVTLASAATVNIGAASANDISITGTTGITAFDTIAAGAHRTLTFAGVLTLNHNATTLILPSAANITTAVGDVAEFVSLGSGNWKCEFYTKANGQAVVFSPDASKLPLAGGTLTGALNNATPVTLASAATVAIGGAASNDVSVTGAVTITAFDVIPAGARRTVTFAAALTLTHNASSLILPSGANIITAAGDVAEFVSLGGGNWRCEYYTKANGQSLVGAPDATKLPLTGGTLSGPLNLAPATTLASAATVNIGAAASNDITITGVTSISAFDTIASGTVRRLTFAASLILTYNVTSLILPTAASITTAAGDVAEFLSIGGGNWKCVNYERASGSALAGSPDPSKLPLTGGTLSGTLNLAPSVSIAAAATVAIGAAAANDVTITGTATITAFDTIAAGAHRTLTFTGVPTLTHNATSLILPTAANIAAAAGDTAEFVSLGSGNWKCVDYQRASGSALAGSPDATKLPLAGGTLSGAINNAPTVTIASAASVAIGAAAANDISVTGAVTITSFDTIAAGAVRKITFTGALTLTHNATSLILPGAANITTAAGDGAQFTSLGGGNWRCDFYTKAASLAATLAGTETLTNKTMNNATILNFTESGVAASAAASGTVDLTQGTDWDFTTNANFTCTLPAVAAGKSFTVTVNYGGTHTLTFAGGTIRWATGVAPAATSVNGKADVYVFKANRAGTAWFGNDGGRNF